MRCLVIGETEEQRIERVAGVRAKVVEMTGLGVGRRFWVAGAKAIEKCQYEVTGIGPWGIVCKDVANRSAKKADERFSFSWDSLMFLVEKKRVKVEKE